MSGKKYAIEKSNAGKYIILKWPDSEHYSCDGEWLDPDEVADLIADLTKSLQGKS